MSESDRFTPENPGHPPHAERRASVRHLSGAEVVCHLPNPVGTEANEAWVRDISRTGINILLERRFEPGNLLVLELTSRDQAISSQLILRVVHTIECPNGHWLHGAAFLRELSEAELRAFI
jgi:hypothetical protein